MPFQLGQNVEIISVETLARRSGKEIWQSNLAIERVLWLSLCSGTFPSRVLVYGYHKERAFCQFGGAQKGERMTALNGPSDQFISLCQYRCWRVEFTVLWYLSIGPQV